MMDPLNVRFVHIRHLLAIAKRINEYELNREDEIEVALSDIWTDLEALRGFGVLEKESAE